MGLPGMQRGTPASVVAQLGSEFAGAGQRRAHPVLDMDSLLFCLGSMIGFLCGYFTAAVLVSDKASTMKQQKAESDDPWSMDQ